MSSLSLFVKKTVSGSAALSAPSSAYALPFGSSTRTIFAQSPYSSWKRLSSSTVLARVEPLSQTTRLKLEYVWETMPLRAMRSQSSRVLKTGKRHVTFGAVMDDLPLGKRDACGVGHGFACALFPRNPWLYAIFSPLPRLRLARRSVFPRTVKGQNHYRRMSGMVLFEVL